MSDPVEIHFQEKLWNKDFILIVSINFLMYLGFQMLHPTLPVYVQKLGGSDATAGLVLGVFALSAVITRIFAGQALDQYGRKIIFFTGILIIIITVFAYIWAPTVSLLLIIRVFHGLGWGIAGTATSTIATDLIPKTRFGEGTGYFNMTTTLTMALAPALGLYLVEFHSFQTMFLVSILLVSIAFLLGFKVRFRPKPTEKLPFAPLEKLAYHPSILIFFITMTYGAILAFLSLYAAEQGIKNIGPFFSVYALTLLLTRPLVGKMADRYGFTKMILPGMVFLSIALFLLFLAHSMSDFLWAAIFYGIGYGAILPCLQAMSVISVAPERRGAANGTFFTGFDLGISFGSVLWGTIAQTAGLRFMFLWTIVPVFMAYLFFIFFQRKPLAKKFP